MCASARACSALSACRAGAHAQTPTTAPKSKSTKAASPKTPGTKGKAAALTDAQIKKDALLGWKAVSPGRRLSTQAQAGTPVARPSAWSLSGLLARVKESLGWA